MLSVIKDLLDIIPYIPYILCFAAGAFCHKYAAKGWAFAKGLFKRYKSDL